MRLSRAASVSMDLYDQFPGTELADTKLSAVLLRFGITTHDLITKSLEENMDLCTINNQQKINSRDLEQLINETRKELDLSVTVENCGTIEGPVKFTSGSRKLDKLLGGGIPVPGLVEISGESSSGKSQLLMQISLFCQLPIPHGGLKGQHDVKVAYITTETGLPVTRLKQMLERNFQLSNIVPSLDNIYTLFLNDWDLHEFIFYHQLPKLIKEKHVKVIIIDSISHHIRSNLRNETNSYLVNKEINMQLSRLINHFNNLMEKYRVSIIVSNQVSSRVSCDAKDASDHDYQIGWMAGWDDYVINDSQEMSQIYRSDSFVPLNRFVPCLNLYWANKVSIRVVLSYSTNIKEISLKRREVTKNRDFKLRNNMKRYFLRVAYNNITFTTGFIETKITKRGYH